MMPFFVTTPRDAREVLSTQHTVRRTSNEECADRQLLPKTRD